MHHSELWSESEVVDQEGMGGGVTGGKREASREEGEGERAAGGKTLVRGGERSGRRRERRKMEESHFPCTGAWSVR